MQNFFTKVKQKWGYSIVGLFWALKEEKSLWAYLLFFAVTVGLGIYAELVIYEWILLVFAFIFAITTEIINTSLEAAVDTISFQYNVKVKKIKDIAAAATLIATIGVTIVVILIFYLAFTR